MRSYSKCHYIFLRLLSAPLKPSLFSNDLESYFTFIKGIFSDSICKFTFLIGSLFGNDITFDVILCESYDFCSSITADP